MKMNRRRILMVVIILPFLLFSFFLVPVVVCGQEKSQMSAPTAPAEPSIALIDELLAEKTVENCEKAIKVGKLLLKNDPDNPEILYRLANSYIGIMDIKTSALIEEKDEYKPMLKEMGKIACDYAEKAYKLNPKRKEIVAANLVSYGYYSASFGIVKAILKGAAGHYKDLCNELIEIDDTYLGALGYHMLGKLYHVAPWPVGSKSKALEFFQKAVKTDNTLLYSHYNLGLLYFEKRDYDRAEKEFTIVQKNTPNDCEKHYIDAYKKKAGYFLMSIARVKKRK
jgi:tetratricopeptide (TPR) repeat protein